MNESEATLEEMTRAAVTRVQQIRAWTPEKNSQEIVEAALQAAGVDKLAERIAELGIELESNRRIYTRSDNDVAMVNALLDGSRQANDTLKARIAELEAELATFREVEMREVDDYQKVIAELDMDTKRLQFLIAESGMDGFSGHDAYDFIVTVMAERGHDEPTDDDELEGWRRLIDAVVKSAGGE